jgi:hypothetical protein
MIDGIEDIAGHDVEHHIIERNTSLGLQQSIFLSVP